MICNNQNLKLLCVSFKVYYQSTLHSGSRGVQKWCGDYTYYIIYNLTSMYTFRSKHTCRLMVFRFIVHTFSCNKLKSSRFWISCAIFLLFTRRWGKILAFCCHNGNFIKFCYLLFSQNCWLLFGKKRQFLEIQTQWFWKSDVQEILEVSTFGSLIGTSKSVIYNLGQFNVRYLIIKSEKPGLILSNKQGVLYIVFPHFLLLLTYFHVMNRNCQGTSIGHFGTRDDQTTRIRKVFFRN